MLTLALDTTTRAGSVAVVRDTTVLSVVHGDSARTHGERLPEELARALRDAGVTLRDLDLLTVASGPGAFTGLRIGLAAMQGVAMVQKLPVVAVSALDALASAAFAGKAEGTVPGGGDCPQIGGHTLAGASAGDEPRIMPGLTSRVAAWMDAQRGEVFAAYYVADPNDDLPSPAAVPIVAPPHVVLASMPEMATVFIGDGAVRYSTQILQDPTAGHRVLAPPPALAPFIARLGIARAARGEAGPPHALQPLYVRRPDAELERLRNTSTSGDTP